MTLTDYLVLFGGALISYQLYESWFNTPKH
ncbi:hypothetical protein VPHD529_0025 [Vibrio phage D529]